MQRRSYLRIALTALPLTVLCIQYGLWLVLDLPEYGESLVSASVLFLLFAALLILLVPRILDTICGREEAGKEPLGLRSRRGCAPAEALRVLLAVFAFRCLISLAAYLMHLYTNGYTGTFINLQRMWGLWSDSELYLGVAGQGYAQAVLSFPDRMDFSILPLYSYIVRFFALFSSNLLRSGFFVSLAATMLSGLLLYDLVLTDYDRRTAGRAVCYFCLLPASFFLSCTMADALFFLLSTCCLYLMRKRIYWLSGLMGALAAYCSIAGVALFLPLTMEFIGDWVRERREQQKNGRGGLRHAADIVGILTIPAALCAFLLQYSAAHGVTGVDSISYLYESLHNYFALFFRTAAYQTDHGIAAYLGGDAASLFGLWIPNLIALFLAPVLLLCSYKRLRNAYTAYFLGCFFLIAGTSWLLTAPRNLYCCVPVVIAMAVSSKKRAVDVFLRILCALLLLLYLYAFVARYPVY